MQRREQMKGLCIKGNCMNPADNTVYCLCNTHMLQYEQFLIAERQARQVAFEAAVQSMINDVESGKLPIRTLVERVLTGEVE